MTLINCASILGAEGYRQEFSFVNPTGSHDDSTGLWGETRGSSIDAFGSIQPVPKSDMHEMLRYVDSGEKILSAIIIYTESPLIVCASPDTMASIINYNGLEWKVVDIEDYSPHGHKEVIAVRAYGQNG